MPRRPHRFRRPTRPLLLVAIALLFGCTPPGPATVDVDGQVVGFGGEGATGVVVQAQGRTTVTDGEGRFALTGLTTPYDVVLSRTGGGMPWLHAYEGLTTAAPILDPRRSDAGLGATFEAEVNGAIVGGALPAGRRTLICAEGLDAFAFGCTGVEPGEDAYAFDVRWARPGPVQVRLHALRMIVAGAGAVPTGYEGYATFDLTLTAGVPSTAPLALGAAPATTSVAIDVGLPSGVPFATAFVSARVSAGMALPVATAFALTGPITMQVPDLPVGGVTLAASAASAGGTGIAWAQGAAADLPALVLPVAPQPLLPAEGAGGVGATTEFRAAVGTGDVVTHHWWVAGGPRISLTTTRTEVTLPDLTASGIALPAGANLTWTLYGHGPIAVDEAVGEGLLHGLELTVYGGLHVDLIRPGVLATGPTRNLTLAP